MIRRASKIDDNQPEIVKALRSIGCTVELLHTVGSGCPDILVGYHNENYLIEIKDGNKFKSQQKLTPDQIIWHDKWRGQVSIASTIQEAINIVTSKN